MAKKQIPFATKDSLNVGDKLWVVHVGLFTTWDTMKASEVVVVEINTSSFYTAYDDDRDYKKRHIMKTGAQANQMLGSSSLTFKTYADFVTHRKNGRERDRLKLELTDKINYMNLNELQKLDSFIQKSKTT